MILDILNKLAATPSTNAKQAILKKHKDNILLKDVFRLAYNKRIVYGIKKIPELQLYRGVILFQSALDELGVRFGGRLITGNAAIQRLQEIMGSSNESDREVIRRIVMRDLECGTGATIANKIWGKDFIPSQPCMLATSYSDKALAKIKYPAIAQLKADGTRCMVIKRDGEVTAWSRNGKEHLGLIHIIDAVKSCEQDNFVLDGELVYKSDLGKNPKIKKLDAEELRPSACGDLDWMFEEQDRVPELSKAKEFQEPVEDRQTGNGIISKSQKGTISLEESNNIVLQTWDFIPVDDYMNGVCKLSYASRMDLAKQTITKIGDHHIEWIETHVVNNLAEAKIVYQGYIDQELEGIILKGMTSIWEDNRCSQLVKFKEIIDFDAEIVGYYPHKKDPNKLGGLTVQSSCGLIQTNCGSGFKDKKSDGHELDRSILWEHRDELIGKIVELKCNGAIKRKKAKCDEAPYKLFLPIIKCFRIDKDIANTYNEVFG